MYPNGVRVNRKSTLVRYVSRATGPSLCLNPAFYHRRYVILIGYSRSRGDAWVNSTFEVLVQGSEPSPYHVTFRREGDRLTATCTCAGAAARQLCKHRLALLSGDGTAIVSDNAASIQQLPAMLAGEETEAKIEEAKRLAHAARKALARIMLGL